MVARYALQPESIALWLAAPSGLGAAANVGGGTFGANTYFWKITATNANGETIGSNEATVAVAANGTATLTWNANPAGTTGIKVYRGTASNGENVLVATLGNVVTYTDTGSAGTAASPPASSSAFLGTDSVPIGAQRDSASLTVTSDVGGFTATPPTPLAVGALMAGYLATYPNGPQL